MTTYAYLFEAKSIQSYILDSGKLRDLVGASELVDMLCGTLLDDALMACGLAEATEVEDETVIGDSIAFARKAGGAFYAFSGDQESIGRLAALWPLAVQQHAPGLAFDQARGKGQDAYAAFCSAYGKPDKGGHTTSSSTQGLRQARSRALAELPQAGPLVLRSQRTGRPAVEVSPDPDGEPEPLDAATARQRWALSHGKGSLIAKLAPPDSGLRVEDWPQNMEPGESSAFPFEGDNRYIAVIHADGNGLGQLLIDLEDRVCERRGEYLRAFRRLSDEIERATCGAVQKAVEDHLLPAWRKQEKHRMVPARPIVLGGDDLTMIVRADLALPFTRSFLIEFEKRASAAMQALRQLDLPVPERLTACAGIAYIKAGQPFYLGASLAEGIAAAVKRQVKEIDKRAPPSSLAWHRITTAMIDDYERVLERELTIGREGSRYRHTLGAYVVSPPKDENEKKLPLLDNLLSLQRLFRRPDMARGPTRQILTLIDRNEAQAKALYRRWSALMQDPANNKVDRFNEFASAMMALLGTELGELPYRPVEDPDFDFDGPLGDLHTLLAVKSRLDEPPIPASATEDPS